MAVRFHLFGNVFDTEGGHGSLERASRVSLDEDAIADAAVKVAGGGNEDQIAAQLPRRGGKVLRQRQQHRESRRIFDRRGKRRIMMAGDDDALVLGARLAA